MSITRDKSEREERACQSIPAALFLFLVLFRPVPPLPLPPLLLSRPLRFIEKLRVLSADLTSSRFARF